VFSAADIAEPVLAFDATTSCGTIRAALASNRRLVAVLRDRGLPVGYVMADQLGAEEEVAPCQPFRADQVLAAGASLPDVFEVLTRYDVGFVEALGVVCGVVRRSDMQKPAVRMWLFGTITTIEMLITRRVRDLFPGEHWRALLSAGRLAKATELREERTRLGESCDLIDCLQFGDKVAILLSDPDFPRLFGYQTRLAVKDGMNGLQRVRNHLAQ
jgi:hypothetical protein